MSSNTKQPWHIKVLALELESRKSRNPKFSMRAFARMLDVPAPILSETLRLKRKLLPKYAEKVCDSLEFSEEKKELFLNSVLIEQDGGDSPHLLFKERPRELEEKMLLESKFSTAIEQWEYFAILNLFRTEDFQEKATWIAKRLNISAERARQVVLDLKQLGLLTRNEEGKLTRTHSRVTSTLNVPSKSIRKAHEENLKIAAEKLHSIEISKRFFLTETMAIDPSKLEEATELIQNFKQSLAQLLEEGKKEEVYRMSIQLFPLSDLNTH